MAKKDKTTTKCPLCETKIKLPSYKCKNCNNYYTDNEVTKDKGDNARCPKCKFRVKRISFEDLKRDLKCKECGFNFAEIKSLKDIIESDSVTSKEGEKKIFENELEALSQELDKILGESEEEVEEVEKVEVFECPDCGSEVGGEAKFCSNCGLNFLEIEELPETLKEEEIEEKLECPECGAKIDADADKCTICGKNFSEEEDELFACPNCDAVVDAKTTVCPKCRAEFVEEEEEEVAKKVVKIGGGVEEKVKGKIKTKVGLELEEHLEDFEAALDKILKEKPAKSLASVKPKRAKIKEKQIAGRTNGLTNGIKKDRHDLKNSVIQDPTNGMKRDQRVLTNGLTNGLPNGLTNGLKRVKRGLTNGITNGITNGLTNGLRALRAGITNGLTNGNGITNGLGKRKNAMESRPSRWKVVVVPIIILILVLSPYIMVRIGKPEKGIEVNGNFTDWKGVETTSDTSEVLPFNPNVDIVDYRVDARLQELSFYLRVEGDMLEGEPGGNRLVDTAYIFIDKDRDSTSGYFINGIGADYMLEVCGWEGKIIGSILYTYEQVEQDWNNWESVTTISSAVSGSQLEVQVPFSSMYIDNHDTIDILFYMQSWNKFEDFSDLIISNEEGVLQIKQQGIGEKVISGNQNKMLKLELKASKADITLTGLSLKRTGSGSDGDVGQIWIEDENGYTVAMGTINNKIATFLPNLEISEDRNIALYVVIDLSDNTIAQNSVGFKIENNQDIEIDKGTVTLKNVKPQESHYDISYIATVPDNITIDGAFGDWEEKLISDDPSGDVDRAGLDIQKYGVSNTDVGPAFYLKVDGEICGGVKVPYWNSKTKTEPLPGAGPGGGEEISVVIPPKTGEDYVYIFVDTIKDGGYSYGIPIDADYMIEIKGRYNRILSCSYYEWTGASFRDWNWAEKGSVEFGMDLTQMEVGINWDNIGVVSVNHSFDVFFLTTDWENRETDYSDHIFTAERSTRADFISNHVHPNGVANSDAETLDYLELDEDAPGDSTYEPSGDKNDPNVDWIEVYFPSVDLPSYVLINNITLYYGYYTETGWQLTTDALSNITWRVDATQKNLGNYTNTYPPEPNDTDKILVQTTNLPTVENLNSGNYKVRFRGVDNGGQADYFWLDYCYFTVGYTIEEFDLVINEILFDIPSLPYDDDWNCRKKIIIHSSKVESNLTDFPMLIHITDSDLKDKAQSDGDDIMFVASDNETKLDHEIESYNSGTGELIAWVRIPYLSSTTDTIIYMYYNNSNAVDQSNPNGVWIGSYSGVWHLKETGTGTRYDSTSYSNDGTPNNYNGDEATTGKINGADDFDGSNDFISMHDVTTELDTIFTFAFWMKADDLDDSGLACFHDSSGENKWRIEVVGYNAAIEDYQGNVNVSDGNWHYVVGVCTGSKSILYVDGKLDRDNIGETPNIVDSDLASISQEYDSGPSPSDFFNGILDEVRISNNARSADWISTSFNNQNDPNTFYTVNDEDISPKDWSHRKPITINSSQVTGDLDAFPVLVHIIDSDLANDARSDGYDIIFTDWDGKSKLYHEIESYNGTTGELIAWVKIPSLSSSSDTLLYMYYGNSSISSPTENSDEVWNSQFVGIWHLNETGDGTADEYEDSSTYDNHGQGGSGTSGYVPTRIDGKICKAQDFDGTDDHISAADSPSLSITGDAITLEAWVNYAGSSDPMGILSKDGYDGGYRFLVSTGGNIIFQLTGNTYNLWSWGTINSGSWHHIAARYDGSWMSIYIDGIKDGSEISRNGGIDLNSDPVWIGHGDNAVGESWSYPFHGFIDEVRISNVARSADWVQTEFNNQNDTASFLYQGSEEDTSSIEEQQRITGYEWVELFNGDDTAINLTGWYLTDNDGNTFNLTGAGTIPVGGYLVCHLGDSGTNSSTHVYGPIINTGPSPKTMLENYDDLGLVCNNGFIIDYIAWGSDPGEDDIDAVALGLWINGEYIDTSEILENETIGRDKVSTDIDTPSDWENPNTNKADPYGVHSYSQTPCAINLDTYIVINEIMYNPEGSDDGEEWVEIYNYGDTAIDLTGWYLTDNDGAKFYLGGAGSIPAGGYLVCHIGKAGTNSSANVYGSIIRSSDNETIQPDGTDGKDNYLDDTAVTTNYGSSSSFRIRNDSYDMRPIIQFDLSGVSFDEITGASIWLYRYSGSDTTNAIVNVHRVTQSWTETGSNWDTYDGTNDWPVSDDGGDYDGIPEDTQTILAGVNAWYSWNITDLVKKWMNGTYSNYGMIFTSESGSGLHWLRSSDYNIDPTFRPKLVVNYSTTSMLGNNDDLALVGDNDAIWDYVVWGGDVGADDDAAVASGDWDNGDYVDTSLLLENQTLGRDKDSNDTHQPEDWENETGYADPFGIDRSTENGSTPGAQNFDYIIPEFSDVFIPLISTIALFIIVRTKVQRKTGEGGIAIKKRRKENESPKKYKSIENSDR
ncbi:MAG: hypothetical protein A7315_03895 [Candidatus Altiarchaeales archaeon WOR_SM1_79]|nr:MAG: hypothetical protein A7315_03895 [Candidatus Altiarchaeales archaeon WOR_SM1_79]